MRSMNRRHFLARGAAGVVATGWLATGARRAAADPLGLPIGLQLYTVREQINKGLEGTLKQVTEIGYTEVELFSFFEKTARDLRKALDDAGLRCRSAHYPADALQGDLGRRFDYAKELGLEFVVCPFPGFPRTDQAKAQPKGRAIQDVLTLDVWKWNADLFNKVGEQAKKADLTFAYHNHHLEFIKYDGVTAFDEILRRTDPNLVKIELDCGWVKVAGDDPASFIARHKDRVALLHVKDVKAGFGPTTSFGPVPFTEVGRGSIDWKAVFEAAKRAGVKRYYVEQDTTERPPMEAIRLSYDYLHGLKV